MLNVDNNLPAYLLSLTRHLVALLSRKGGVQLVNLPLQRPGFDTNDEQDQNNQHLRHNIETHLDRLGGKEA